MIPLGIYSPKSALYVCHPIQEKVTTLFQVFRITILFCIIPVKTGIQKAWIPACAGMTVEVLKT